MGEQQRETTSSYYHEHGFNSLGAPGLSGPHFENHDATESWAFVNTNPGDLVSALEEWV